MADPRAIYLERLAERRRTLAEAERKDAAISRGRLVSFVIATVVFVLGSEGLLSLGWTLAPLLVFVALVVRHELALRAIARARRAIDFYEAGLRRLDDDWAGSAPERVALVEADHPYARDLDLFGSGSLFELLCTARTAAGERALAAYLAGPSSCPEIAERQAAVAELRGNVGLAEDLALAGAALRADVDPDVIAQWGRAPSLVDDRTARLWSIFGVAIPLAGTILVAGWVVQWWPGWPAIVGALAVWWFGRVTRSFVARLDHALERPARELGVMADLLARLEREPFGAPRLVALQRELVAGPSSASATIARLRWLTEWFQAHRSQLFGIVAAIYAWGVHFGLALERWRRRHGHDIDRWFAALGELEALCALGTYAFEHPDDPFPELVEHGPLIEGQALAHPLIPRGKCQPNDVDLGQRRRAYVISGSNMSGKSTYMRTVGINVVLAMAGAPVRARWLRLSPLQIGASIRVEDSLQRGTSRFYAEITRLRQISGLAHREVGLLFLLDEVLHGTNSHDRRIGASALLASLVDAGAIGMLTTHDLALAADVDGTDPRIDNVHFRDELVDGELRFDYRMRPGVVQTSNALALMRSVGLEV